MFTNSARLDFDGCLILMRLSLLSVQAMPFKRRDATRAAILVVLLTSGNGLLRYANSTVAVLQAYVGNLSLIYH